MADPIVADPGAVVVAAWAGCCYHFGAYRWRAATGGRGPARAPVTAFRLGLVVVVLALASPLDVRATRSLTAHMIQHVLLLSVAAPLLALGAPFPTLLWSLPDRIRRRATSALRRGIGLHDRHTPGLIGGAIIIEGVGMWTWHLPVLYDAAVANPLVHGLEHACFLFTATAAWWMLITTRRTRRGAAALGGLASSLPGMALGAAMVLAPRPWYPPYAGSAVSGLRDQQVAGVVMWAIGGMAAVIAGAGLFVSWLGHESRGETPERFVVPPLPSGVTS